MEKQAADSTIDHAFLDAVELEIGQALQRAAELEANLESLTQAQDTAWQDTFVRMNLHLASWEDRLGELTRQTTVVEQELNEQENVMRGWFTALGVTNARLTEAARL